MYCGIFKFSLFYTMLYRKSVTCLGCEEISAYFKDDKVTV